MEFDIVSLTLRARVNNYYLFTLSVLAQTIVHSCNKFWKRNRYLY